MKKFISLKENLILYSIQIFLLIYFLYIIYFTNLIANKQIRFDLYLSCLAILILIFTCIRWSIITFRLKRYNVFKIKNNKGILIIIYLVFSVFAFISLIYLYLIKSEINYVLLICSILGINNYIAKYSTFVNDDMIIEGNKIIYFKYVKELNLEDNGLVIKLVSEKNTICIDCKSTEERNKILDIIYPKLAKYK